MKINFYKNLISQIIKLSQRLEKVYHRNFMIIKLLLLLFIVVNIMSGCSGETEVKPEHFEKIFGKVIGQENRIPDTINIIIDRSASIKGFVSTPNNQFIRTIQNFIQNIPQNIPIQIFELDAYIKPIKLNLLGALNLISNASFFNGNQTNISAILDLPEVKNKNNLTLIFSDWIHSLKNDLIANQMIIFSRELKEFIKSEGLFAMFGKKAPFVGTYYVECKPPTSLIFAGQLRPYFCIVLGSKYHSNFLEKYIQPFYEEELVIGSQEHFHPKFNPISEFKDYTDSSDSTNTPKIELGDADSISFSILIQEEFKFDQEIKPFFEAYDVKFDCDSIIDKKLVSEVSIRLDSLKKLTIGLEYFLTLFLPHQENQQLLAKLSFYKEMPEWVTIWSTDCDNNLIDAQNVYQLNRWINEYIYNDLDIMYKTSFTKNFYIWR